MGLFGLDGSGQTGYWDEGVIAPYIGEDNPVYNSLAGVSSYSDAELVYHSASGHDDGNDEYRGIECTEGFFKSLSENVVYWTSGGGKIQLRAQGLACGTLKAKAYYKYRIFVHFGFKTITGFAYGSAPFTLWLRGTGQNSYAEGRPVRYKKSTQDTYMGHVESDGRYIIAHYPGAGPIIGNLVFDPFSSRVVIVPDDTINFRAIDYGDTFDYCAVRDKNLVVSSAHGSATCTKDGSYHVCPWSSIVPSDSFYDAVRVTYSGEASEEREFYVRLSATPKGEVLVDYIDMDAAGGTIDIDSIEVLSGITSSARLEAAPEYRNMVSFDPDTRKITIKPNKKTSRRFVFFYLVDGEACYSFSIGMGAAKRVVVSEPPSSISTIEGGAYGDENAVVFPSFAEGETVVRQEGIARVGKVDYRFFTSPDGAATELDETRVSPPDTERVDYANLESSAMLSSVDGIESFSGSKTVGVRYEKEATNAMENTFSIGASRVCQGHITSREINQIVPANKTFSTFTMRSGVNCVFGEGTTVRTMYIMSSYKTIFLDLSLMNSLSVETIVVRSLMEAPKIYSNGTAFSGVISVPHDAIVSDDIANCGATVLVRPKEKLNTPWTGVEDHLNNKEEANG